MSIEKYLDREKAERFLELFEHGDIHQPFAETDDSREYNALVKESVAKQVEIYGEPKTIPFDGRCRRCGREFDDPVPPVVSEGLETEIVSGVWCAACNTYATAVLWRGKSAYGPANPEELRDPLKHREVD